MRFWCSQQLAVNVAGPDGATRVTLQHPYARIGSAPENDVVLPRHTVEGRSLYLHATDHGIYCLDLRKAQVAARQPGAWLSNRQEVAIGHYRIGATLSLSLSKAPLVAKPPFRAKLPTPPGLEQDDTASYPRPVLALYCRGRCIGKRRVRSSLQLVGRWQNAGLQLRGQHVSGVHCALYWQGGRLWCIDLVSSNQTLYLDEPITCTEVEIGEKVDVGEFSIRFERLSRTLPTDATRAAKSFSFPGNDDRAGADAFDVHNIPQPTISQASASDLDLSVDAVDPFHADRPPAGEPRLIGQASPTEAMQILQAEQISKRLQLDFARLTLDADHLVLQAEQLKLLCAGLNIEPAKLRELLAIQSAVASLTHTIPSGSASNNYPPAELPRLELQQDEPIEVSFSHSQTAKEDLHQVVEDTRPRLTAIGDSSSPQPSDASSPEVGSLDTGRITQATSDTAVSNLREPQLASLPPISGEALPSEALQTADTAPAEAPAETPPSASETNSRSTTSLPAIRRSFFERDRLVDGVIGRMAELERARSRARILYFLGIAVTILVAIGIVGGVWCFYGQQYLPLPRAVQPWIPEPISDWLRSLAAAEP